MSLFRIVAFVCFLSFSASATFGQAKPSELLHLYEFHIEGENIPDFENYVKKVVEAAEKTASKQRWMAFQGTLGSHFGTYFVAMPLETWAEMDQWQEVPQMVIAAFGEEEAGKVLEMGRNALGENGFVMETYSLLDDYSTHFDPEKYASNFYRIIRTEVKPEMVPAYRSLLEQGSTIDKNMENGPMTIRRSTAMGTSFRFLASTPFSNYAELDEMNRSWAEMRENMGELATDQFFETLRKSIVKREIFVLKLRRDLSNLE